MIGRYLQWIVIIVGIVLNKPYRLMTEGEAARVVNSAVEGLGASLCERTRMMSLLSNTALVKLLKVQDGDSIVFMNFRADRAREITRAFVEKDFTGFTRKVVPSLSKFVMLTRYQASIDAPVAYMPQALKEFNW